MKLSDLVVSKQNARTVLEDDEDLKNLSSSIKKGRLIDRLILRKTSDDKFEIIAGQRRFKALKLAYGEDYELSSDDYVVLDVNDDEAYMLSLSENIQRKEFSPLDLNRAYLHLNAQGKSDKEIATLLGVALHRLKRLANLGMDSNRMPEVVKDELSKPPSESKFNDMHWDKIRSVEDTDVVKDVVDYIVEHETPAKDVPTILKSIEKNHLKEDTSTDTAEGSSSASDVSKEETIEYAHKGELVLEQRDGKGILRVIGKNEDAEVPIKQYLSYLKCKR